MAYIVSQAFLNFTVGQEITDPGEIALIEATPQYLSYVVQIGTGTVITPETPATYLKSNNGPVFVDNSTIKIDTDGVMSASGSLEDLGLAPVAFSGAYSDLTGTPTFPVPAITTPLMDGTVAIGTSVTYARADHVHPTDTTKLTAANNLSDLQSVTTAKTHLGLAIVASSGNYSDLNGLPSFASVATTGQYSSLAGTPNLSNYATLASPVLTGTPQAPTATAGTNTTQIATTAFVETAISGFSAVPNPSSTTPLVDSSAGSIGTLTTYARADHSHPIDTTRAPVASPTFTGTVTIPAGASISGFATLASPALAGAPTAPTATAGTNTTQIATTAFVETAIGGIASGVTSVAGNTGAVTLAELESAGLAPLANPAFTGTPVAPTALAGTSTTQIATTAFVETAVTSAIQNTGGVNQFTFTGSGTVTFTGTQNSVWINKTTPSATAVTLPTPTGAGDWRRVTDAAGNANTYTITITPTSGLINGQASWMIQNDYGSLTFESNGTNWIITSS